MNSKRGSLTAGLTLSLAVLAVYAALVGLWDQQLYEEVYQAGTITRFLVTGSLAQDLISLPAGILLALLALTYLRVPNYKTFITMLGLVGYFFYGYGLYALQGQYTTLYLVYLAIFGLGIYTLICGLTSFEADAVRHFQLPAGLRKAISAFLLLIIFVLVPIWLVLLTGDLAKHIPRDTYGVFVLDLCVVFPAFGVIVYQLLRNQPFGSILAGVALLKALTVCLSVGFGEWFQAAYGGLQLNLGMIAIFTTLTLVSLILLVCYLKQLSYERG